MLLNDFILRGQLFPHLLEIDETSHCRVETLITELLKRNPTSNKAIYQMEWVQYLNSLKALVEEIASSELVYSWEKWDALISSPFLCWKTVLELWNRHLMNCQKHKVNNTDINNTDFIIFFEWMEKKDEDKNFWILRIEIFN